MRRLISALESAGRRVLSVREVSVPRLTKRFAAAKARLGSGTVTTRLYHGTSVEAAAGIERAGFLVPSASSAHAFGRGVNLTPDPAHTLLYIPRRGPACLVVCDVAIKRTHVNISREVEGSSDTVPDRLRPRPGFDAMTGANGLIVVVPSVARVLPRWIVTHVAK